MIDNIKSATASIVFIIMVVFAFYFLGVRDSWKASALDAPHVVAEGDRP